MKKLVSFAVVIFMISVFCTAIPVKAGELVDGNISLGQDHVKMTWYLVGYEKSTSATGAPSATVRKYYTNVGIKNETVELLMSKFGIDAKLAADLYFTEYLYNYSENHKMFSVLYLRHYNDVGNLIHGTEFNGFTEETKPTFVNVDSKGPSGLALNAIRKKENIPDPSKPAPKKPAPKKK